MDEPMNATTNQPTAGPDVAAPLAGITVIEIGHSVAAPFGGQVLGDLGATVIKVENPAGGDDARRWGPPFLEGTAATFHGLNRNKHSLALDLKDDADRERLLALMRQADVVIQNMRPGLTERLGIGAETARRQNPRLIYCNLGAFGTNGPLRHATGYDPLVQAFSGIMSVTGEPGRPPVRVGPSLIDQGTGLWSALGIIAALFHRTTTGEGCTIDASLYETALSLMTIPIINAVASGKEPGKSGSQTPMLAPYRAFEAADRFIIIAAGNDNLFRRLCEVLGAPEWADAEEFRHNRDRVANRERLNGLIAERVAGRPARDWIEGLDAVGVPCAPVQTVSEVLSHPQTDALGILGEAPGGARGLVATPLRFDGRRPTMRDAAPTLGGTDLANANGMASE